MTRRTDRDQRGVSLILVLVTLVIFGLIVPVLGQFGSTNGVSGYVLKGNRFDRYAAEAGMQAAINWAQGQRQAGRQSTSCPGITTDTANGGGANAARTVTVQCAGFDANGLPAATDSIPQYALQARGGDSDAIRVQGNGSVRTSGAWWSEGGIRVQGPTVDATSDYVGAKRSCDGIGPDDASPLDCGSARTSDPSNVSVPADPPVGVDRPIGDPCAVVRAGNGTVTLAPGLHWDENFFDQIGDGRCRNIPNVTIVLAGGGPHIFDFTFFRGDPNNNAWKINPSPRGVHVVVKSEGSNNGTCASPTSSPVLFAHDFQMEVDANARVEICGAAVGTQQVSIAQVQGGTDPTNVDPVPTATPTQWTVDALRGRIDNSLTESPPTPAGVLATTQCTPDRGGCAAGSIQGRLSGNRADGIVRMIVPDPTPPNLGAKIERLHLAITHLEDNPGDVDERHVWIDGLPDQFDYNLTNPNFGLDAGNGWHTNEYDCELANDDSERRPYFPTGSLTVNYEVQLQDQRNGNNPPDRESNIGLDAVAVSAVYAEPTTRTSLDNQTVLKLVGGGAFRTDGTVNLPTGDMTAELQNAPDTKFERGLVVNTIDIKSVPAQADFVPFSLPHGGNYTDRLATFQAFLGSDTTSVVTARVRFCDAHPDALPGGTVDNVSSDCRRAPFDTLAPARILAWDPKR